MTPATKVIRIEKNLLQPVSGPKVAGTTDQESELLGRGGIFDEGEE